MKQLLMSRRLWALLLLELLALFPSRAYAQPAASTVAAADAPRVIAKHADRCVVGIYCKKDVYSSYFGTGAVISSDGQILTSTTVVPAGATEIQVIFPDFLTRTGTIVETNDPLETTIVKVDAANLPYLALARDLPAVGRPAYTLSNANNALRVSGHASFSRGTISGVYEVPNLGGESVYAGVAVETTAAINPGSDGGPILNERGQVCAIISLNVSPLRWQGVGVPTKVLLERLASFQPGKVKLSFEPLAGLPAAPPEPEALARVASELAPALVGLTVKRKFAPELLPRTPWEQYRQGIADWDKLPNEMKTRRHGAYYEVMRLLEVNQMLRRPAGLLTGVLVSPEGHVLTSVFNVGTDTVYLPKSGDQPLKLEFKDPLDQLLKVPDGGYRETVNPVEQISVTLADGRQHAAKVVAHHRPLGVALLKIEGQGLPHVDLAARVAAPELGMSVGLIGRMAGPGTNFTFNEGIVSAASRQRGFQFQTDALLNYGNSGGLVFTANGRIVGLAAAPIEPRTVIGRLFKQQELTGWNMAPNSGVSMVARSDRIQQALEELKAGKSTTQLPGPYLGLMPDPGKVLGEEIVVGGVAPKSPAEAAGIRKGDRVLSVNGQEFRTWKDLTEYLSAFKPGDKVDVKVHRTGITRKLLVNGREVANESQLQELMQSLKPDEKFTGTMVVEDTKVISAVLGGRP